VVSQSIRLNSIDSASGRGWRRPPVAIECDAIDELLDEVFARTLVSRALSRAVRVHFGKDATTRSL